RRAVPFAARDEHFCRDAACGYGESLPGIDNVLGDFVAVESAECADVLGVKALRFLGRPITRPSAILSPRSGESQSERFAQEFQQFVPRRLILRLARSLDSFEPIFKARIRVVDL